MTSCGVLCGSDNKNMANNDLNDIEPESERHLQFPRWKRVLDLTCVAITIPCWLPLMFLVALGIKVVSPGPILFRQERVGYRGRRFVC